MQEKIRNSYFIECACYSFEHIGRLTFDDEDMAIDVRINHYLGFWKRLQIAFKYLFKISDSSGNYNTIIIKQEQIPDIIKMLEEAKMVNE